MRRTKGKDNPRATASSMTPNGGRQSRKNRPKITHRPTAFVRKSVIFFTG
jgi:hypothetical protein